MKELYRTLPNLKPLLRCKNNNRMEPVNFPIKAPLISKNPSLMGHAYDDFFQLYCQRLNQSLLQRVEPMDIDEALDLPINFQMDTILKQGLYVRGFKSWDHDMTEQSIVYGKIDQSYRSGIEIDNLLSIDDNDFQDMESLIRITHDTSESFIAKSTFISRPTFGSEISYIVGGADADLILDQTLIDIKVYSSLAFSSYPWHQLLTYYILGKLTPGYPQISKLAIWNPRYDVIIYVETHDIMQAMNFNLFVEKFIETLEYIHKEHGNLPLATRYIDIVRNQWTMIRS